MSRADGVSARAPTCKAGAGRAVPNAEWSAGWVGRTPSGSVARVGSCSPINRYGEELEQWGLRRWRWSASLAVAAIPAASKPSRSRTRHGKELARWSSGGGGGGMRGSGRVRFAGSGAKKFDGILSARQLSRVTIARVTAIRDTSRDTSPPAVETGTSGGAAEVSRTSRSCERCGDRLAAGAASGGALLLKACRQAALLRAAAAALRPRRPATARALRPSAGARCPAACDPRRAIAQSAAGRPPPALGSRARTSQAAKRARRPPVSSGNPRA